LNWNALLPAFGLVFVAELGDKTQLAVVTQTCKSGKPWPVFFGANLALVAVTAMGAAGGEILGALVPETAFRLISAAAFVVMGVLVWREAVNHTEDSCQEKDDQGCEGRMGPWDWKVFGGTFTLLFFAELGDKTQLAVIGLASKQAAWVVFAGSALALMTVTGLGVVGGERLCRLIPTKVLLWLSAAAFVVVGVLMGLGVF
jgi:putative Ca2+/H+ antiporter (TMEM165/GDT1 family)